MHIRRIGFAEWFGTLDVPDTAAVLRVTMQPLARSLSTVTISADKATDSPLARTGFYDRWLMRQKGVLTAVFISPEELEFRHPAKITSMLSGLNGVQISQGCVQAPAPGRRCMTGLVAYSRFVPGCRMAVVIDGMQQYPSQGANVDIDMLLDANDVAAIEVYPRGGNTPVSFQYMDTGCGIVAFWTGSRQP